MGRTYNIRISDEEPEVQKILNKLVEQKNCSAFITDLVKKYIATTEEYVERRKKELMEELDKLNAIKTVKLEDEYKSNEQKTTSERKSQRSTKEWDAVSKWVRIRDKYTCRRCGVHYIVGSDMFPVHHIISSTNEKYRYDVDNLVLLCEPCHKFVHSPENTNKEWIKDGEGRVDKTFAETALTKTDYHNKVLLDRIRDVAVRKHLNLLLGVIKDDFGGHVKKERDIIQTMKDKHSWCHTKTRKFMNRLVSLNLLDTHRAEQDLWTKEYILR